MRRVNRAYLPLGSGEAIDLDSAYEDLKTSFDVRYDPECNFKAMYVIVGSISFCVFRSGVVTIAGNASYSKERKILGLLWAQHLRNFVY